MAQLPIPFPPPNSLFVDQSGKLTQSAFQYFSSLDVAVRAFFTALQITLVDAPDDAAAAAAGVPIGGLYRTGLVLQIRVA